MRSFFERAILFGLASLFLLVSGLLLRLSTYDLIPIMKWALITFILLLVCLSWVCFTWWLTIELHHLHSVMRKFFKLIVDAVNRKR